MRPFRHFGCPAQIFPQQQMHWGGRKPFFSAKDMGYFHSMIIDYHGQVIGRHTVGFEQHLVIDQSGLKSDTSPNHIIEEYGLFLRHFDANGMGMPIRQQSLSLSFWKAY